MESVDVANGRGRTIAMVMSAFVLAGGLSLSVASSAQAAPASPTPLPRTCVETDNDGGNNGGKACWYRNDQRYTVKDIDADGHSAKARVKYRDNGKWKKTKWITASGNGSKSNNYVNLPRGHRAKIQVCLSESGRILRGTCDQNPIRT